MPANFDGWMTCFWLGLACLSLSLYLVSRRITLLEVAIFWFAVFPVLEHLVRESARAAIKRQPEKLWALELATFTAYGMSLLIVVFRVRRDRRRRSPGLRDAAVAGPEER